MKPSFHPPLLLAVFVCLSGCHEKTADHDDDDDKPKATTGIAFTAKQGLSVPEDTARHVGLRLAEVSERRLDGQLSFTAQVFAESGDAAHRRTHATAWVAPELARALHVADAVVATGTSTNPLAGSVSRVLSGSSTNSPVEVLLEFPAGPRLGEALTVTRSVPAAGAVTVVPSAALLHTVEGAFVYVSNGPRLLRTPVKPGAEHDGWVEIKDGLLAGDRVVVAGLTRLWLAELSFLKSGEACCAVPEKR